MREDGPFKLMFTLDLRPLFSAIASVNRCCKLIILFSKPEAPQFFHNFTVTKVIFVVETFLHRKEFNFKTILQN